MNHLAHFFLAEHSDDAFVGALLGDFVKGKIEAGTFPAQTRIEIMVHRHIDAFTDSDAQVSKSKQRFIKTRRRFAGIALDVAFDHFLVKNWSNYTNENLREFTQNIYAGLSKNLSYFPINFQTILPRMIADDWLISYMDFERLKFVLQRLSMRVRGGESLLEAFAEIKANYGFYNEIFKEFFPRLQAFVIERRKEISHE